MAIVIDSLEGKVASTPISALNGSTGPMKNPINTSVTIVHIFNPESRAPMKQRWKKQLKARQINAVE